MEIFAVTVRSYVKVPVGTVPKRRLKSSTLGDGFAATMFMVAAKAVSKKYICA